jgi:hypothetical protein
VRVPTAVAVVLQRLQLLRRSSLLAEMAAVFRPCRSEAVQKEVLGIERRVAYHPVSRAAGFSRATQLPPLPMWLSL